MISVVVVVEASGDNYSSLYYELTTQNVCQFTTLTTLSTENSSRYAEKTEPDIVEP